MAGLVPAIHVLQTYRMRGGWVYILTNKPNGILYTGVTRDLARRSWEHRDGKTPGFTRRYGVKRLVWCEHHDAIASAIQREKNMKHWPRAWKVRLILAMNPDWDDLYERLNQ
jgi:putative endonuclease